MKKIILIGAGGHCVSCIDVIENQRKFKIVGLIDNNKKNFLFNYRILGSDKELKKISKRQVSEKELNYLKITLASPDKIKSWSWGEI